MKYTLNELIQKVLIELKHEGYTEKGIKKHSQSYSLLTKYAEEKNVTYYSEQLGQDFVFERYGALFDTRRGNNSLYVTQKICHLEKLWYFQEYDSLHFTTRLGKKKAFQCPKSFFNEYNGYLNYCDSKEYTSSSKKSMLDIIKSYLTFLETNSIESLESINADLLYKFFSIYLNCSKVYLKSLKSRLSEFFGYLYDNNFVSRDLRLLLPNIRYVRDAFIPSSWNKNDTLKLLESIDRNNPCGRRDYAMILIVVRLGLRTSDIHKLKLSDFDWENKKISIVQTKTRNTLDLPLLDDVGWAVIDYLKNGRPKTDDSTLFVRHSPEGGPFSDLNRLSHILHKHMRNAGIHIPKNEHRGFHSLRSSLARTMLESGATLPVISEVLGHTNTLSTSHYLKINIDALRKCSIDPDEVFLYE